MNLRQFLAATQAAPEWFEPVKAACDSWGIVTAARQAHFLAQVGHESGSFKRLTENLNYGAPGLLATWPSRFNAELAQRLQRNPEAIANHVYGGRLGNTQPGDGWRFRGRGLIMITGRGNYRDAGRALALGLEEQPELAEKPWHAAEIAAWYWSTRGLNELADKDDLLGITRRINGGTHGLEDRRARLVRAKEALR